MAEPGTCRYRYQSFFNLIEETRFNRSFSELNGTWGDAGRYHLEALWSSVRSPRVRSSPSYPFVTLLNTDGLEVGPDHPGRVALCDRSGAELGRCAGAEPWYFRGRSIGNAGPAFEVPRESEVFRLAGSVGGLATFLDRTHDYDLGVSWSRTTGSMTDHGTYTERLFLAFRGFGGPDCGVGVLADASSPAKMRLNPSTSPAARRGRGAVGTSTRSATPSATLGSTAPDTRARRIPLTTPRSRTTPISSPGSGTCSRTRARPSCWCSMRR